MIKQTRAIWKGHSITVNRIGFYVTCGEMFATLEQATAYIDKL